MYLSVSLVQKLFYYFVTVASFFGVHVEHDPYSNNLQKNMVVTLTCPNDTIVSCAPMAPPADTTLAMFLADKGSISSNCGIDSASFKVLFNDLQVNIKCNQTRLVTLEIKDSCGGVNNCSYTIKISDETTPVVVCPGFVVSCAGLVPPPVFSYKAFFDSLMAHKGRISDNCFIDTTTFKFLGRDTTKNKNCITAFNDRYQIGDSCGNIAICNTRWTIVDNSFPSFIPAPDITVFADGSCMVDTSVDKTGIITNVNDNCGIDSILRRDIAKPGCFGSFDTVIRIWKVIDYCGKATIDTQFIYVKDTIKPFIGGPNDTMVTCAGDLPLSNIGLITVKDNCTSNPVITVLKDSISDSICPNHKIIWRTYTASDKCNNIARFTQKIIVNDTVLPTLICPGDITIDCASNTPAVTDISGQANDNCQGVVIVNFIKDSVADSTCTDRKNIWRIFKAEDLCHNSTFCTQRITIKDSLAPSIICPESGTVECVNNPFANLDSFIVHGGAARDNCKLDSASFLFKSEQITQQNNTLILTRHYSIKDVCGNEDSCAQTITSPICFADLALKAIVQNNQLDFLTKPGGTVPACFIIYNQGFVTVDSIKIVQYLFQGTSIISGGWVQSKDSANQSCYFLGTNAGTLPAGGLKPGDSIKIYFTLKVAEDIKVSTVISKLEINNLYDALGNALTDMDSHPDNNPNNDTGGVPLTPDDNKINGDSRVGQDEDDADPLLFYVEHPLTCIANVDVSTTVDVNCGHCVTPYDVLKGILLPESFYDVIIYDSYGNPLKTNCLGREHLGLRLTYKVFVKGSLPEHNCWGNLKLEDKTPPQLNCSNDTIYCVNLNGLPALPDVQDNCSGPAKVVVYNEVWKDYGCDSGEITGVYIRTIKASDVWGNTSQCDKKYYIRKINLDSVVCPRDTLIDCNLEYVNNVRFTDPLRSGTPTVRGIRLYPNNPSCNNFVFYRDDSLKVCGYGYKILRTWIIADHCTHLEKQCVQVIKVLDKTPPVITSLKRVYDLVADPHTCNVIVPLDLIRISDCSKVTQRYSFTYFIPNELNKAYVQAGVLPDRISVPIGKGHKVYFDLTDDCGNKTIDSIVINVTDHTPPTPVCKEYTQLTLDPQSCWTRIAASDLDNGSHDNCCSELHFAAAFMEDIDSARNNYKNKIIADCGDKEYWNNKAWYDAYIEEYINCFIFKDTLDTYSCGTKQVVLRVYEACDIPRRDAHVFPCSPHAWYCYNTSWLYRVLFNYNFRPEGAHDCNFTAPWKCKATILSNLDGLAQYNGPTYLSNILNRNCYGLYATNVIESTACPRQPLYNDCMVQILLDDKTPPRCVGLEDITVYCDSVPGDQPAHAWEVCDDRGDVYGVALAWPGNITYQDGNSVFGYYGGSTKASHDDHNTIVPACEYDPKDSWSPIYCKNWLSLDRYDTGHKFNASGIFWSPVWVDKNHESRSLKAKEFYVIDNCQIEKVTSKDDGVQNQCGEGWLSRTWTIVDKCGNTVICTQKIIVKHRSDFEVIFPEDKIIDCTNQIQATVANSGTPIISDDDCELVGVQHIDDTFDVVSDACYKILRKWIVIDACIDNTNNHNVRKDVIVDDRLRANQSDRFCIFRNLKDNGDGYMTYTQIIKIVDTIPPKLQCKDTVICYSGADCQATVHLPIKASDNCSTDLTYTIYLDKNNDGVYDETVSNVTSLTKTMAIGKYSIKVEAFDHCQNVSSCTFKLELRDCKSPTPYCINGLATAVMPSSGSLELWAKDLDKGSYDNCTSADQLRFYFDANLSQPSRALTCKDIPNGKSALIPVSIWVVDEAGNKDYCNTYVLFQDNGTADRPEGVCKDTTLTPAAIFVNGTLLNESKEAIEKATVKVVANGVAMEDVVTNATGTYAYPSLPYKGNISITPVRNDDAMNGISTIDLIMIQKHITGEKTFSSPYKMIAADVDHNNEINVIDLLELRKLVLGVYDAFPNSESWRFIPKSYVFNDPANPWAYPVFEKMDGLDHDVQVEFTGVKVGDVNSSAIPHSLLGTEIRESSGGLVLKVKDQSVKKGQRIQIPFYASNFNQYIGWQGTLSHEGLHFESIQEGVLDFNQENLGVSKRSEDLLSMSWNDQASRSYDENAILFTMTFTASRNLTLSEAITVSSLVTMAESYQTTDQSLPLSIRFEDQQGRLSTSSQLYQNYPNPFNDYSVIGLRLKESMQGSLTIYDIQGKVLKSYSKKWDAGYQEVRINKSELPAGGVMFYKFESKDFTASRKMVLINK